jgi:outer membrane protein assembly factor BamB
MAIVAAILAVTACTSSSAASGAQGPAQGPGGQSQVTLGSGTALPHPAAAWPEYNQNSARTGVAAGLPQAGRLTRRWNTHLDGAVYGQPLVVGGLVIAATENDTVYALNRSTGKVAWHSHVGTPVQQGQLSCGNIFPLGITGTPIYEQGNGLVYAVAEMSVNGHVRHVLFGLSVTNGAVRVRRDIDVASASNNPANDQQRPALAIDGGRVYAAFGGLYGDCGQYRGMVVGVPLSGAGPLIHYQVPTSREGAIWGTAGPVAGPHGYMWVSSGNGAAGPGNRYDGSDSVIRLGPSLHRVDFFAPAIWAQDNAQDLDLGSTQPVLAAGNSTFIMGKRGVGYLLNTLAMGGIGHQRAARSICAAFGAAAVSGSTVYEPCNDGTGMAAIVVNAQRRIIRVVWRGPANASGSPVAGGGAVWVTSYSDGGPGTLYELNPGNGAVRSQISIPDGLPHFSSASLAGGTAFLGTMRGVTAVNGV